MVEPASAPTPTASSAKQVTEGKSIYYHDDDDDDGDDDNAYMQASKHSKLSLTLWIRSHSRV